MPTVLLVLPLMLSVVAVWLWVTTTPLLRLVDRLIERRVATLRSRIERPVPTESQRPPADPPQAGVSTWNLLE